MKTIISYLDDLKDKCGSDYKAAKLLKTNQSTISNIRSRNQCGDETAIKIADLLGIDRGEVLIAAAIARSSNEDVKHAWEKISTLSGIAASVVFACNLVGYTQEFSSVQIEHSIHYTKSNTKRNRPKR